MRVRFMTGSKQGEVASYPLAARHCGCGDRRQFDGFTCWRCGFFPLAVIEATWALAARGVLNGHGELATYPKEEMFV